MTELTDEQLEQRIDRQIRTVRNARGRRAIEAGMMSDTVRFRHLCFYRPTFVHAWVVMEMEARELWQKPVERLKLAGWVFTHDPEQTRNELPRRLELDAAAVRRDAIAFFERLPEALGVAAKLFEELLPPRREANENDVLEFGWWSAQIHRIASSYHWSERDIFAMPLIRLLAYDREILTAPGERPERDDEMLPEEIQLQELMRQRLERKQHGGS